MGFVDLMVYPWFDRSPAYLSTVGRSLEDGTHSNKTILDWRGRMLNNEAVAGSSYSTECYKAMLDSRRSGKPSPDVGMNL